MARIDTKRAKRIQTYLKEQGTYDGTIDGGIGEISEQAIYALKEIKESITVLDSETNENEPKTAHFCLVEFKCKDGTDVPKELWSNVLNLMNKLEELRAELCSVYGRERAIYINSAYRHVEYNRKVGSGDTSQHVVAKAADIRVEGLTPKQVYKVADRIFADGGVGIYDTFVHVDVRDGKSRWDKR